MKKIEYGLGIFGDINIDPKTWKSQSMQQRLLEIIEQVKLADELGIDVFAAWEHHREDYAIASPEMLLASLAPVTKNIILSSWVSIISSADPVKLYSDFSTIDLISDSRAEIMAWRWSFIESFPLFWYELKDYDGLFEEKLQLLLEIMKNEKISWSWKYRANLENQTVLPRAKNNWIIPVWIAVWGTPESVIRAAKLGLPVMFAIIGWMRENFEWFINLYKSQYKAAGHDIQNMQIWAHMHTFVADSKDWLIENYYPLYSAQMDRIGKTRGRSHYTLEQFIDSMDSYGALVMWDTQSVANKIGAVVESFWLTRFIAHMDVGWPLHQDMKKSISLYAQQVIPALNNYFSK